MTELAEIAAQLSEPFALDDIDFLPKGKVEREGRTLCMALPYADPRTYQDRLNALCPGEWNTPMPTAVTVGNKLICYVTVVICGVPHSDVGEADAGENQGTEAWAQGFKRACSQAGLGRYLYNLEKEWVPFNVQRKQIDLDKAGKAAIVRKMYQKAGIGVQAPAPQPKPAITAVPTQQETPTFTELNKQCNAIFGVGFWQTMVQKALKLADLDIVVKEQDLTSDDRIQIKKYLDYAQSQKKAS